jgi:flagellar FliJ protein
MKRFKFTLESVLQLRMQQEDEIKRRLAQVTRQIQRIKESIKQGQNSLSSLWDEERAVRVGEAHAKRFKQYVSYQHKLKLDIVSFSNTLKKLRNEAEQINKELTEARRKRRSLEQLQQQRFDAWKKNYIRQEQKYLDEVSQNRYIRRTAGDEALSSSA